MRGGSNNNKPNIRFNGEIALQYRLGLLLAIFAKQKEINMRELSIKKNHIIGLFIYFSILLIVGCLITIIVFVYSSSSQYDVTQNSIFGAIGSALIGSTIFYIRKLYKGLLSESIKCQENNDIKNIGVLVYFIFRPIFSICFSLFILIGMRLSVSFIQITEQNLNVNYVFLGMMLSFIAGFGAGDIITLLEIKKENIIIEGVNKYGKNL